MFVNMYIVLALLSLSSSLNLLPKNHDIILCVKLLKWQTVIHIFTKSVRVYLSLYILVHFAYLLLCMSSLLIFHFGLLLHDV